MKAAAIIAGLVLYFAFVFMIARFLALNDRYIREDREKSDKD